MNHKLLGGWALPLWKMMELKSVGMMKFPTEWQVMSSIPWFQSAPTRPMFVADFQATSAISSRHLNQKWTCQGIPKLMEFIPTGEDGPPDTKKKAREKVPIFYGLPGYPHFLMCIYVIIDFRYIYIYIYTYVIYIYMLYIYIHIYVYIYIPYGSKHCLRRYLTP